jgi:hypothetical protein
MTRDHMRENGKHTDRRKAVEVSLQVKGSKRSLLLGVW